jgi:hypothetical protein
MRAQLTTTERGYGGDHQIARKRLTPLVLAGGAKCARCGEPIRPGEEWDLGHVDGDRSRYSGPEHRRAADCRMGGNRATSGRRPSGREQLRRAATVEEVPEPAGFAQGDPVWAVPWMKGFRRAPTGAAWPRLMTVPHPAAVGSLGPQFIRWVERRSGRRLRWWQRLVATRLLEVDVDGRLVWETLVLTMARQLGKSWLLRELCMWRMHQADRFGEPQDVLHTGKDLPVCIEVQRPARMWARARAGDYRVREANGQVEIELLGDGSRWMVRAKDSVYGYSAGLAAVDEAWKVKPEAVDEGVTPTMVEREQAQLLLVSTAHRLATALMLSRRRAALEQLGSGEGDLLIEWSAPKDVDLADVGGWRLASPHWSAKRQRLVAAQLELALAGESVDPDEPDPIEAFRAQWLNQWPGGAPRAAGESLLPAGLWAQLAEHELVSTEPLYVAVEDDFGLGAAVAAAVRLPDGRIEVGGWLCPDWDAALDDVAGLGARRRIRHLQVGASMLARVRPGTVPPPRPAGGTETRDGLSLLRDLATSRQLVHDIDTAELDGAIAAAQVREASTGLRLMPSGKPYLVKALVWAVSAAHKPVPEPGVY